MKKLLLLIVLAALAFGARSQTYLLEEFFNDTLNLPATFTTIDFDGDGNDWRINTWETESYAVSDSWRNGSPLTPENYLITPQLNLTGLNGTVKVRYTVQVADESYFAEKYKVAVSTTGNQAADFTNVLFTEVLTLNEYYVWKPREVDLTQFIGNNIYLTWCHFDCTDQYKFLLDSIQVMYYPNVGINDNAPEKAMVYNDQISQKLYISGDYQQADISVFNTAGQEVMKVANQNERTVVSTSILKPDVYIVRIQTSKGIITRKVAIVK